MSEARGNNGPHSADVGPSGRKIIYDKDGKPCRSCNTLLDFQFVSKTVSPTPQSEKGNIEGSKVYKKVDPPDVEQLGRSSWTLLHTVAATYPEVPSDHQKKEMNQFMNIFSHVYPCSWCGKDFEDYIRNNAPKVDSREELGKWLCDAHNEVNEKLGKEKFNCDLWKKRWVDGWN
ncbi:flavin-linked sulfhydryl oxidase Ecym_8345 [Eremothecium cymbalariae DBVPG|uniref:Sulfhydryl oxidase n=1 Tax=Eremothecium cymbalariae (strain CBS 270.75 / DBVPG 7215 / KCTC 17166 / NRRL Y-17582) TaxID=931890 RepID=G8JXP7_ERECY|nr:Hypothetical protein Ecym_8345 [Eremothecium cymbalariae DBVPG\